MRFAGTALFLVLSSLIGACAGEAPPQIGLVQDPGHPDHGRFVATLGAETTQRLRESKLDTERWRELFSVRLGDPPAPGTPAMLGRYRMDDDRVVFEPRFPLVPGESYTALWAEPPASLVATLPMPSTPPTQIVAMHPTADRVPANLLRFTLDFSAPMSRGHAARFVSLREPDGPTVEQAFVAPETELWNENRDRLTLLLAPGRIKRGVGPNLDLGPPLRAGRSYELVVEPGWPDGAGRPLASGARWRFQVGEADHVSPGSDTFRIQAPADSGEALMVDLAEPLDHGLLLAGLAVVDANGHPVRGSSTTCADDRRWTFRPATPWATGGYELRVSARIEDLAGNRPGRRFEERVDREGGPADGSRGLVVPFELAFPPD